MEDWRSYDDVAEIYGRVHAPRFAEAARDLVRALGIEEGQRVLDVGTGTGAAADEVARTGAGVVGIDRSLGMLSVAHRDRPSLSVVGAEAIDLRPRLLQEDVDGQFRARQVRQGARLEQHAGPLDGGRKLRQAGCVQRREGERRLAVEEPDGGETRRHGGPRRSRQALVDLVLEEFARLIEQVELDETVGEPAHDLVAAPADGRELLEIEVKGERVDAREGLALA